METVGGKHLLWHYDELSTKLSVRSVCTDLREMRLPAHSLSTLLSPSQHYRRNFGDLTFLHLPEELRI